jgi:selenocysteine lyase/cysteine desulfurase
LQPLIRNFLSDELPVHAYSKISSPWLSWSTRQRSDAGGSEKVKTTGYQSIGSFHSENLASLLSAKDSEYCAPSLPFEASRVADSSPRVGVSQRHEDFMLDLDEFTFLNHGAFGAALVVGWERAEQWRRYLERQPLRYFDRDLLPHLVYSTRRLASFVNAPDPSTLLLLPNVTAGLNSVLGGYAREHRNECHVIMWDTSYGSVKKMANHYMSDYPQAKITEIPFLKSYLPRLGAARDQEEATSVFLDAMNETLDQMDSSTKSPLLILDHTSSNTALTFPIESLSDAFKSRLGRGIGDCYVVVDGAHGLLAQDVDARRLLDVDCYLTNGHKWLGAPRGVAFLLAPRMEAWKDSILRRPAIVSHGVDEPDVFSRFVWDGCRDYTAALAIPAVLDYWESAGPADIRLQLRQKLQDGIHILAQAWFPSHSKVDQWPGFVTLAPFPNSDVLSPMALVRVPDFGENRERRTSTDAKALQDFLYDQNVEVPVKCVEGRLYLRLSCHIYNEVSDFARLAEAVDSYAIAYLT